MNLWVIISEAAASAEEIGVHREAHLQRQVELEKAGVLFAAGPLFNEDGNRAGAGMIVIRAESAEAARQIAELDPMHANGVRSFRMYQWMVHEGRINISLDISDGSGRVD